MIHVDPASPEFETLPPRERAVIYASLGWDKESLLDEFDVSADTLRIWLDPEARARKNAQAAAYYRTEHGRAKRREWYQSPAGERWRDMRNARRRAERAAARQQGRKPA